MRKGIAKYTAFCLAAGLTFGEGGIVVMASGADQTLVGIKDTSVTAVKTTSVQAAKETSDTSSEQDETSSADQIQDETDAQAASDQNVSEGISSGSGEDEASSEDQETSDDQQQTQAALDTSMVGTTGFAVCDQTVNVRSGADTSSDVVGSLRNHAAVEILGVDEYGWYKVKSGNVTGYVAGTFIATGEDAQQIAASAGYTTAEVGSGIETLNVRADASADSEIVGTVSGADEVEVVEDQGDWVKVVLDDGTYGYVSTDYVYTSTEYASAETVEEEQARLDQQWLDYLASQSTDDTGSYSDTSYSSNADSGAASYTDTSSDTSYTDTASYDTGYAASSDVQSTADAASSAYAVYVEAQNAADAAVANGEGEDAINSTAAAAQEAYAAYLTAQNAADAAAAGYTADTSSASSADTSYTDTSSDVSYTETQTAEDTSYTETTEDTSSQSSDTGSSYSSTGAAIAAYACQFVGNPYVYGGSSLTNGADCSGFVMSVFANFGISLPHEAAAQSGYGTSVSMDDLQPGDLLFYEGDGGIGHVTIYIGNGQVVHASNPSNGICISSVGYRTPCMAKRLV